MSVGVCDTWGTQELPKSSVYETCVYLSKQHILRLQISENMLFRKVCTCVYEFNMTALWVFRNCLPSKHKFVRPGSVMWRNSLDPLSVKENVMKQLWNGIGSVTRVIIAHRLALLRNNDSESWLFSQLLHDVLHFFHVLMYELLDI